MMELKELKETHLASDVSKASKITKVVKSTKLNKATMLPIHYKKLLNIFLSLDVVVNKLIKSKETLFFYRVDQLLNEMTEGEFNVIVFGQILTVFPESYSYEFDQTPVKITRHHENRMRILPNLTFGISNAPRRASKFLTLSQMTFRKATLEERLFARVREKHDEFMATLYNKNLDDLKEMKLSRWSSKFDLNTMEIIPSEVLSKQKRKTSEGCASQSVTTAEVNKDKATEEKRPLRDKNQDDDLKTVSDSVQPKELLRANTKKVQINEDIQNSSENKENIKTKPKKSILRKNKELSSNIEEQSKSVLPVNQNKKDSENTIQPTKITPKKNLNQSQIAFGSVSKSRIDPDKRTSREKVISPLTKTPPKTQITQKKILSLSPLTPNSISKSSIDADRAASRHKKVATPPTKITPKKQQKTADKATPKNLLNQSQLSFGSISKSSIAAEKITPTQEMIMSTPLTKTTPNNVLNQSQLSFGNLSVNEDKRTSSKLQSPKSGYTTPKKVNLPFHLKALVNFFDNFEKALRDIYNRGDATYVKAVLKATSATNTFTEIHLGQVLTLYPSAYKLKWMGTKGDLRVLPVLNDGLTESSNGSIANFNMVKMKQRSNVFLRLCCAVVDRGYQKYLAKNDSSAKFNVDLDVESIEPTPMPPRPTKEASKKLASQSIKESYRSRKSTTTTVKTLSEIIDTNGKLKSLPKAMVEKLLLKGGGREQADATPEGRRRSILPGLHSWVNVIVTQFRRLQYERPISKTDLMKAVCCHDEKKFDEHIKILNEISSGFLKPLNSEKPTFQLAATEDSISSVYEKISSLL